jgi:hypothetical protein
MTDRAQPGAKDSIIRNDELSQALSAFTEGGIVSGSNPTAASIRRNDIDETALDAFSLSTSSSSLDVTVAPGEAFVGGWLCRDTATTISLPANSTSDIIIGFNVDAIFDPTVDPDRDAADEVLVDLSANVADLNPQVVAHQVTTDGSGVTGSQRVATVGGFSELSVGSIGGLNHDNLNGVSPADHHTKTSSASELTDVSPDSEQAAHHFKTKTSAELIDVSADGITDAHHSKTTSASGLTDVSSDSTSGAHHSKTTSASDLTDVSADSAAGAHHSRYTDSEAQSAVDTFNDGNDFDGLGSSDFSNLDSLGVSKLSLTSTDPDTVPTGQLEGDSIRLDDGNDTIDSGELHCGRVIIDDRANQLSIPNAAGLDNRGLNIATPDSELEAEKVIARSSITENGQDVLSSPDGDFEIQKNGTDGNGIINFKT